MSLVALAATGAFAVTEIKLSLLAAPGVVVGFLLSTSGAERLELGHTRPAVLTVSALAAVSVVAKTVL